eukprot:gene4377-3183_t
MSRMSEEWGVKRMEKGIKKKTQKKVRRKRNKVMDISALQCNPAKLQMASSS